MKGRLIGSADHNDRRQGDLASDVDADLTPFPCCWCAPGAPTSRRRPQSGWSPLSTLTKAFVTLTAASSRITWPVAPRRGGRSGSAARAIRGTGAGSVREPFEIVGGAGRGDHRDHAEPGHDRSIRNTIRDVPVVRRRLRSARQPGGGSRLRQRRAPTPRRAGSPRGRARRQAPTSCPSSTCQVVLDRSSCRRCGGGVTRSRIYR